MSESNPNPESPRRWHQNAPRWVAVLVIISLALNVLFVGGAIARGLHHHWGGGMYHSVSGMMALAHHLPRETRQEIRNAMREEFRANRANHHAQNMAAMRELADILAQERINPNALETFLSDSIERMAQQRQASVMRFAKAASGAIAKVPLEDRRELSEELSEHIEEMEEDFSEGRGRGHKGKDRDGGRHGRY